ncbi:DUF3703 domain-containing protein [Nonomuraea sp. NPDC004186]
MPAAYRFEMRAARTTTDDAARWRHLERAHVISQPWPWPHTANHVATFVLAVRRRDRREAIGQVTRRTWPCCYRPPTDAAACDERSSVMSAHPPNSIKPV